MSDEAQAEEILDRDFLMFLSMTKTHYSQIADERHKTLCTQWLTKLCGEKVHGIAQKRNRNIFLSQLLMNMQERRMSGPFLRAPDERPLSAAKIFFSPLEYEEPVLSQVADGESIEDFEERSADNRTYVAIRSLPNDQGTYAFIALNIDKEQNVTGNTVVPCSTDKSKLRHVRALHKLSTTILGNNPSEAEMERYYIQNLESKLSGDISELYESVLTPKAKSCGRRKNEIAFYDVLVRQIDEEIKGIASDDHDLIKFLVSRLEQDLQKEPRMSYLCKLNPVQKKLKLLEILRQKVIVRQQEEKRKDLLSEMEDSMLASSIRTTCCNLNEPADSMWQLAITQPLPDSEIKKLYNFYPEEAITTFLDLLSEDRQMILERGKKRQRDLLDSMRSEVYKEVQIGKAEYNKVRATFREWNEILSIVEELMYEAGNQVIEDNEVPRQKEDILLNMISNIKETENLVIGEARCGEELIDQIADANMWTFSIHEADGKDVSWDIKSTIENIKREVESYRLLIEKQKHRITELRERLK